MTERQLHRMWIERYLASWNRAEYGTPSQKSIKAHVRAAEKINYGKVLHSIGAG